MTATLSRTTTEQAYADAMWAWENGDATDDTEQELMRSLYVATDDYVNELRERLQERDDVYAEALSVLGTIRKELLGEGQYSEQWEDVQNLADDVYELKAERDETLASLDAMERYHRDHHTGPAHMCWTDACAYVNGNEGIAFIHDELHGWAS